MKSGKVFFVTLCLVALNLGVGAWFLLRGGKKAADVELTTPAFAVESLDAQSLFFNEAARPFVLERKPQLLTDEDKDTRSQRARAFAAAANDPKLWRQLDRRYRFDAVLLSGDPALYRPLLQHLLASADWPLSYLDHTSYIFRRAPAEAWSIGKLQPVRGRFAKGSAKQRADFMTRVAGKLSAINQYTAAKSCLDEAMKIDERAPDAWTQLAGYHAHFSQWAQALTKVDKALAIDPRFLPALASKAQILVAMRRTDDAFKVAEQIYVDAGKDPSMLFLVAKVAHSVHAYGREIEALQRLIQLAELSSQPVSGYRIYLAQAYAAEGNAQPAIEQFEKALGDPDLSKDQRTYVEETIEQIKSRTSM